MKIEIQHAKNENHYFTTFKNSTLVAEPAFLGYWLTGLILYGFRYFSRNGHKIPVPVSDCLIQTGILVHFYPDILERMHPDKAVFSWHSRRCWLNLPASQSRFCFVSCNCIMTRMSSARSSLPRCSIGTHIRIMGCISSCRFLSGLMGLFPATHRTRRAVPEKPCWRKAVWNCRHSLWK